MSDERDEAELRTLFDASAEEPSRAELDQLARFAASIPARAAARSRWRWLPSLRAQRGVAIAGAALAVVAFVAVRLVDIGGASSTTARNSTVVEEPSRAGLVEDVAPGVPSEAGMDESFDALGDALLAELNADSFAAFDDDPFDDSLAGLDVMAGPIDVTDTVHAAMWIELYGRALDDG